MCPTCGHTIQRVNEGVSPVTFWCPRCGTLKTDGVPECEQTQLTKRLVETFCSFNDTTPIIDEFLEQVNTTEHARWLDEYHQQRQQP